MYNVGEEDKAIQEKDGITVIYIPKKKKKKKMVEASDKWFAQ